MAKGHMYGEGVYMVKGVCTKFQLLMVDTRGWVSELQSLSRS